MTIAYYNHYTRIFQSMPNTYNGTLIFFASSPSLGEANIIISEQLFAKWLRIEPKVFMCIGNSRSLYTCTDLGLVSVSSHRVRFYSLHVNTRSEEEKNQRE